MASTEERRFEVLRAIVADYVSTQEPIGSKALVERHNLASPVPPSATTWRPSRPRVHHPAAHQFGPGTDRQGLPPVRRPDRRRQAALGGRARAILEFLESGVDLDDVLRRGVRLLAQLTRQVAVVQYPTLSASSVRHLEVVALTPARLLMVLITDSGRVDQRIVELGDVIDDEDLSGCGRCSAVRSKGSGWPQLPSRCPNWPRMRPRICRDAVIRSATVLVETLVEHPEDRLVLVWTANLTRNAADFTMQAGLPGSLRSVLEALEEQVVVLKLIAATQDAGRVTVRIGEETQVEEMRGTSVISTGYGTAGTVFGGVGVLGPTRMDYPGTIASVAAVARYIGEVLAER
ncbi:heat-inducible transcriptional repressor HrcA [Rhodococcus hoagii]|nr:heat-inducible transcriptional repressor HrcA [Prescottella equi]